VATTSRVYIIYLTPVLFFQVHGTPIAPKTVDFFKKTSEIMVDFSGAKPWLQGG